MSTKNVNRERELLFHYTKFDTALFQILPKKQLLMNSITKTNDIYEMQSSIDKLILGEDWFEKLSKNNSFEYLKRNKLKLLCFSEDGDQRRGFDNSLMWSFYGENYKGICLVFDKNKLERNFEIQFEKDFRYNQKIIYKYLKPTEIQSEEYDKIRLEQKRLKKKNNLGFIGAYDNFEDESELLWNLLKKKNRAENLFFRKGDEWKKESEYRFLIYNTNYEVPLPNFEPQMTFFDFQDSLISVVLGPDFKKDENSSKFELLMNLKQKNAFQIVESGYYDNQIQIMDSYSSFITFKNYHTVFKEIES